MEFFKKLFSRFIQKPLEDEIQYESIEIKMRLYQEYLLKADGNKMEEMRVYRRFGLAFAHHLVPDVFKKYTPESTHARFVTVPFNSAVEWVLALDRAIVQIQQERMEFDQEWIVRSAYQNTPADTWLTQYQGKYIDVENVVENLRPLLIRFFEIIEKTETVETGYYEALRRRYEFMIVGIFEITLAMVTIQLAVK